METKILKTLEDFESLKKGDHVVCEFHRNLHDHPKKPYRKAIFKIYLNRADTKEIILQKKNNLYFNYDMFLNGDGNSNLKEATLLII